MNTPVKLHNLNGRLCSSRPSIAALNTSLKTSLNAYPSDELFSSLFRPLADVAPEIKLDVSEDERSYQVVADMPGVKKEDIHLSVERNEVSIAAEVKRESETKQGERLLHAERTYGKLSRSFVVAQEIDESAIDAKYADGVLKLVLPKKQQATAKRIAIG